MSQFPKNELAQQVIASCVAHGLKHVVISPGSRNAPLTIGFSNHQAIKTYSVVDERCAAFFALGIAQQLQEPVAVLCTSGSALLNYYPAVSEAFYSDIPLVVISADRPAHLIDVGDGQTIRQEGVFKNHILSEVNLIDESADNTSRIIKSLGIAIAQKGPVHINVPFDEPLYELTEAIIELPIEKVQIENTPLEEAKVDTVEQNWKSASKKMILVGSKFPDELFVKQLEKLVEDEGVIVLTETTSNAFLSKSINSIDKAIFTLEEQDLKELQPDLLITCGGMIVSKKIKQFLRKFKPIAHWHIDNKKAFDTFFSLTTHFKMTPELFFSQLLFRVYDFDSNVSTYQKQWLQIKEKRAKKHKEYLSSCDYSDLKVFETVINRLPNNIQLQLANSSIVRYAQLFDLNNCIQVFCNRGTSGIDGSTSTAIGAAMSNKLPTVFITGDISFFYDSNAFWNTHIPKNFKVILINNDGGGIFKIIPGPQNVNALPYFETPHGLNAKPLCELYGLSYLKATDLISLKDGLDQLFNNNDVPQVLEVKTPSSLNDRVLKQYFAAIK
ncbi:2-succinyl-5-enolpyruvyl-6-hydroxy-3-cyclohexene-1-carboxylic-acid synthase [Urechidicola sp. KH5]